jgi:hypothetical protein
MSNNLANYSTGLTGPGTKGEVANYSSSDHTFTFVPRYLKCSASGILKVDLVRGGTNISLPVVPGVNPERVSKIYNVGSTQMTVTGLE